MARPSACSPGAATIGASDTRRLQSPRPCCDGEAVVCGPDGVAMFDALHRRDIVSEAMLYGFDLLELDGEDLRGLPLGDRKKRLGRLLGKRRDGSSQSSPRSAFQSRLP
jgi:ATP-dependent DNA ligase